FPDPALMSTALPAAPEMLPLEALNGAAPLLSRLIPAPELFVDETASKARLEAEFALRTSTAGPPFVLTFSVEPEPTLIVGTPVPERDGRFAGVPVAGVSAPTTRFTGSPSSFWFVRSENPPVSPVVVPSPL